jgi:hypothetical protein
MMIAWIAGALNPKARIMVRAAFALGVCWLVEFSQLYHASVLDSWRHYTIGQLTLGSGFDPRDLGAYALGIVAAVAIEIVMRRSRVMRIP